MKNLFNFHNAKLPDLGLSSSENVISTQYDANFLSIESIPISNVLLSENDNFSLISFKNQEIFNKYTTILSNGNILETYYTVVDDDVIEANTSIVGTIDTGIMAASWSPDEEQLSLITKSSDSDKLKMILFTPDFDILNEYVFELDDLKKSKNVNVGWGNKTTQFRGKGKRQQERELLSSFTKLGSILRCT
ncbi:unnamed protein product [Hanseniaspora opuntiae]